MSVTAKEGRRKREGERGEVGEKRGEARGVRMWLGFLTDGKRKFRGRNGSYIGDEG